MLDGSTASGCGTREAVITFVCTPGAGLPTLATVTYRGSDSLTTCSYQFTIATSLVCSNQSNSTIIYGTAINPNCVFGNFNLSALSTYDITGEDTNGLYYALRLCGQVG